MQPKDLDQKIEKARQLGVPNDVIMQRVRKKYPEYHEKNLIESVISKVMGTSTNIAKDIGASVGISTTPGYQKSQDAALASSQRLAERARTSTDPEERRRMMKIAQETNQTVGDNAQRVRGQFSEDIGDNYAVRAVKGAGEIATAIEAPAAIKAGAKLAGKAGRIALNPKRAVGQALEKKIASAGMVKPGALEAEFGTVRAPNTKLTEGLSSSSGQADLLQKIKREIGTQGRSPGGDISNPTYTDIFNFRKGAYGQARYAKGTPATPEQKLYANIGRAYDKILKEGADTGRLDKAYTLLSKLEGVSKPVKKTLKYILMYKAAESLVNKVVPRN